MRGRHEHLWTEIGRSFSPPPGGNVKNADIELIQQLAFGVTSVELRCEVCGEVTERLLTGDRRRKEVTAP